VTVPQIVASGPTLISGPDATATDPYRNEMRERLAARSSLSETGCRLWNKDLNNMGYGRLHFHGQKVLAHRASLYVETGSWPPPWLQVMHSCDTPACIAPEHLRLGTARDNALDAVSRGRMGAGRTGFCPNGHPYDPDMPSTGRYRFRCEVCRLAALARQRVRRLRTHCNRGHEFTPENTVLQVGGSRRCLICKVARAQGGGA
jgi:hypothetical protein